MNNTINPNSWFTTYDLSLAAALCTAGFAIERLERLLEDNTRARFFFWKTDALNDAIDQYRNGWMRVDSEKFFGELVHLKNRISENR